MKSSTPQYVLFTLALLITVSEIVSRHQQRVAPLAQESIDTIDENIQEYNTMAEQLGQLEILPPVGDQWAYAKAVAAHFLVELNTTNNSVSRKSNFNGRANSNIHANFNNKNNRAEYTGPLAAWTGSIVGPTGQVLAAAQKIQETVPAYIYSFQISGDQSQLTLSVLGSE